MAIASAHDAHCAVFWWLNGSPIPPSSWATLPSFVRHPVVGHSSSNVVIIGSMPWSCPSAYSLGGSKEVVTGAGTLDQQLLCALQIKFPLSTTCVCSYFKNFVVVFLGWNLDLGLSFLWKWFLTLLLEVLPRSRHSKGTVWLAQCEKKQIVVFLWDVNLSCSEFFSCIADVLAQRQAEIFAFVRLSFNVCTARLAACPATMLRVLAAAQHNIVHHLSLHAYSTLRRTSFVSFLPGQALPTQ